jgi:hypothetical protein
MQRPPNQGSITDSQVKKVLLLCRVAEAKGHNITLQEISTLLHPPLTLGELYKLWQTSPALNSNYRIEAGVVLPLNAGQGTEGKLLLNSKMRRERAELNLRWAKSFMNLCGSSLVRVVSVSGSTSYLSAGERDDVDFFCITKRGVMWLYLTKALILARLLRIYSPVSPEITLTCMMDEKFARRDFSEVRDPLYARDALSARILFGEDYYTGLLRDSKWMRRAFPGLYRNRLDSEAEGRPYLPEPGLPDLALLLNSLLFRTVGTYVRLKAYLLNRKLAKQGRKRALFRLRIGTDHLVYESVDYILLRRMYLEQFST